MGKTIHNSKNFCLCGNIVIFPPISLFFFCFSASGSWAAQGVAKHQSWTDPPPVSGRFGAPLLEAVDHVIYQTNFVGGHVACRTRFCSKEIAVVRREKKRANKICRGKIKLLRRGAIKAEEYNDSWNGGIYSKEAGTK